MYRDFGGFLHSRCPKRSVSRVNRLPADHQPIWNKYLEGIIVQYMKMDPR
jgi:hypothetical protein